MHPGLILLCASASLREMVLVAALAGRGVESQLLILLKNPLVFLRILFVLYNTVG